MKISDVILLIVGLIIGVLVGYDIGADKVGGRLLKPQKGEVYTIGLAAYHSVEIGSDKTRYYRLGVVGQPGEQFIYLGEDKYAKVKIEK